MIEARCAARSCFLSGLSSENLDIHQTTLFQLLVLASAVLWKRQVLPYGRFPWNLLAILDSEVPHADKRQVAASFRELRPCMMDRGVTKQLHAAYGQQTVDQLLEVSGDFCPALRMLALNKVTNVEIELNFARASSSRQYLRGNSHGAATMTAKHVACEIKHQHDLAILQEQQLASISAKADLAPPGTQALARRTIHLPTCDEVAKLAATASFHKPANELVSTQPLFRSRRNKPSLDKECPNGSTKPSRRNGWHVFLAEKHQRVPRFSVQNSEAQNPRHNK